MSANLIVRGKPSLHEGFVEIRFGEFEPLRVYERVSDPSGFDWILVEKGGIRGWLQEEYTILQSVSVDEGRNLEPGKEKVDRFHSLPPEYCPGDLAVVPDHLTIEKEVLLRPAAIKAFHQMISSAASEGLRLAIFSGYRDPVYQRGLYLKQIQLEGPKQRYVARPCHSEHQLGTAADLVGEEEHLAAEAAFAETREAAWIRQNCRKFGLRLSYTLENQHLTGYLPEPWHLRFVGSEIL